MNDLFRNGMLYLIVIVLFNCCGNLDRIAVNVGNLSGHACK